MINTREKNCIKWAWFLLFWHNSIFWFYGYEYIQLCTLVASFYIYIHILFVQLTWNLTDLCPREQIYQIHCLCTVYVVYIHQIGLRLPKIRNTLYQTNEVFLSSFIFFQSFNCTHTHTSDSKEEILILAFIFICYNSNNQFNVNVHLCGRDTTLCAYVYFSLSFYSLQIQSQLKHFQWKPNQLNSFCEWGIHRSTDNTINIV